MSVFTVTVKSQSENFFCGFYIVTKKKRPAF